MAKQLELIRQCVGAREPGGAHMVELVKVMMAAVAQPHDPELERCEGVPEPVDLTPL